MTAVQVRAYLSKAEEYAAAASNELEAGRGIAATSLAIHAAINAADAVCGARLGERAAGQDHDQVLGLLKQAGNDGAAVGKDLRRLLPMKTKAEYDPDDIPLSAASKAVTEPKGASPLRDVLFPDRDSPAASSGIRGQQTCR